jgi:VCBS repeat-containing protein
VSVDGVGPNNQLLYTPEPNATGTVEITYTVTDQTGGEETESAFVEIISEKSDRAFADLVIRVTGVNDAPVLGGTEDDQITDKESTFPFDAVTLSDIDEGGDQEQTATVLFDSTLGAITSTGMTELSPGEYQVVGTPAQVVAALRAIEFTPFENLEPPIYYDVDFTLTITDGYIPTPIVDVTTVTVLAINDAPDPVDDSAATTPENQVIRFLADATLLPPVPFDFGDLDPDFQAVNGTGGTVTLLPVLQTPNLLANDIDVDIDDDETTIELINVHQTDVGVDQITATSALGATVVLDIRALRAETNILYDPRGSATLNALPAGESLVDSFYYTVIDQHGAKGIAKVSIIVTGVNDVPTAQNDGGYEVGEDGTILLGADDILSNDTDPDQGSGIDPVDDDAPIISNVPATSDLGANLTWNLGDDDITYDPTGVGVFEALSRNEFIEDSITYTISDENGGTSMATIALEIEGFNDAPIAADDLLETDENITNVIVAGARGNDGLYAAGLLSNDTEIDFDGSTPDDDHWVIPQREVTSPLGAALHIETDGSYSYDANSRLIDSLIEDEIAEEVFPYIVTDNFRTSTSPDSFKVLTDSTDVVLPVLSNDDVAGSVPVAVLGYTEDLADTDRVIIESANHELRDGLLVKIQSYVGTGAYNGVYPITVVDRNHFSVESPYAIDPAGTLGTWRPWFNITAFGETDQEGVVTISADAQTLVYTPKAGFYGSESFQYTIEDGIGGQDVTDVAITVLHDPLNNVLSGSDDRFQIGKGESAVEVDVLVNDNILPESGSAYTITGVAPDSATGAVSIINGGTGLSYTPLDTNFTGVDSFTYTVSGGGSSSTQATVTFNVIDREDYLDGSDDDFVVVQDSSANLLDVAANDASLPSFPVSFEVVAVSTPSAGGAASVDNGQVSYTPLASYTGLDSFTYTIRDASGGNITKTVDVQVVSNADDFYALDDHYIIVAGSGEYDLAVMFNDVATGANSSNLSIVNLGLDTQAPPAVERVAFTPGLIKYTVPATVPVGGKEVFNYEITDGTDQRREAVITVTIVDALPTLANALDDNYHVAKNASAHSLDVMLNDLPLPSAGWAWTITSATAASQGGSVVVDGGTAITYSPAAGFYGVESFDYTIEDIFGDASSATVTVAVGVQLTEPDSSVVLENSSLNDFPVLQNDDLLERFAADYTISAVGTPDQAGAVVIDGSGPNNQLLYTPAEDFVGEETFTYTVVDKTGGTAVETVTVEVIAEESDRDFAELRVEITGVNDTPQLTGIANGATTDKLSVKPFPAVSIIDLDEWAGDLNKWGGEQLQNITVEYDEAYGTVVTPGMIRTSQGVYQMTGTPAAVTAALNAIVFTPYENFIDYIDPGFFALDFDLSIDDTYLLGQVNDTATIVITPIDDVPTITDPIADMVLQVNAFPRVVQLGLHFADVDDDIVTGQIVWTVSDYTNPSLFNRVTVDAVKQQLVLDFATDQFGVAEITVRGTDRGGLYVEDTFRVTVDGPPVIELAAGETQPTTANYVQGSQSGFRRDYRQSFRVTNEGVLTAAAFILHITELNVPVEGITVFSGTYSTDENGSPNNFNDDTRSSGGVTLLRKGTYYYALKYDFPLEPGESVVVHVTYRVATVDVVPIRPNIRVELTSATPLLPIGTSVMVISNPITGEPTITFMVQSGVSYQMQYSSNLTNWFPWSLIIPVSDFDREITITDDGLYTDTHPSLILQRFYRLVEISIP